jgi:hypothetical protein
VGGNTVTAVGTAAANFSRNIGYFVRYTTGATMNNSGGINISNVAIRDQQPYVRGRMGVGNAVTNLRLWFGFYTTQGLNVKDSTITSMAAMRMTTNGSFDDWHCCSADGATFSCTNMSVKIAANTIYNLSVGLSRDRMWCQLNQVFINKTTNLPANMTALNFQATATIPVTGGAARVIQIPWVYMEHD